jgi:hypothetical protein
MKDQLFKPVPSFRGFFLTKAVPVPASSMGKSFKLKNRNLIYNNFNVLNFQWPHQSLNELRPSNKHTNSMRFAARS